MSAEQDKTDAAVGRALRVGISWLRRYPFVGMGLAGLIGLSAGGSTGTMLGRNDPRIDTIMTVVRPLLDSTSAHTLTLARHGRTMDVHEVRISEAESSVERLEDWRVRHNRRHRGMD